MDGWKQRVGRQMLLDGRVELHVGLIFLIGSLSNLFTRAQADGTWPGAVIPWLALVGYLAILWGSKWLNTKLLPRTGYVVLPEGPKQRRLALALGVAGVLAILGMLGMLPGSNWLWSGFALLFAGTFVGMGIHYRLLHWICIGLITVILTWLYRDEPGIRSWLLVSVWLGSALVLTGAWRLWRFLRANPIPRDAS